MTTTPLHPRNRHHGQYDFDQLVKRLPELAKFVILNPIGQKTINFSEPNAVKQLNKALLQYHYDIQNWDIPPGHLCPPIPGRAEYIHRLADLFSQSQGKKCKVKTMLDIGTGANCIYPLIAAAQYQWNVVATDIDKQSLSNANLIIEQNSNVSSLIELRLQPNDKHIFNGIISKQDRFDITLCNPPFHRSQEEAIHGSERKVRNLAKNSAKRHSSVALNSRNTAALNFGGKSNELWCEGGELKFVTNMAYESRQFSDQVLWFSTLLSKSENVRALKKTLVKLDAATIKVVEMRQGQKISRFVAWTFQNDIQRKAWNKIDC
jgi:23S rRNA (adenine1618-N6)-methyltransferase